MAATTQTPEPATSEPVAIMFVDQVGSTRQCAELGDAAALELHCQLQRMLVAHVVASDGWLASTTGDGVLALFASPARSITAACAIHSALRVANGQHDLAAHTEVRVGIHVGTPLADARGMPFGLCVNLAARICALAGAREVLVSDPVQASLARSGRGFVSPQRVMLRGALHPIRLWRLAESSTPPSDLVAANSAPCEPISVRRSGGGCPRARAGNVVPVGAAARPRTLAVSPSRRATDPPS